MSSLQCTFKKTLHTANGIHDLEIEFNLNMCELATLFGPSGVGKTTALRIIAGLGDPDEGRISFGDTVWYDSTKKINVSTQKRRAGLVFQEYALFPSMSVLQNVMYGTTKDNKDKKFTDKLLDSFGLLQMSNYPVTRLSGGQQQRVALARAIAAKPQVLLLDEPMSSLDPSMRRSVQDIVERVHRDYSLTTLLVSHDLGEIFRLSNKVYCLQNGKVVSSGTPSKVFTGPSVSGRFNVAGEVVAINHSEIMSIVSIAVGYELVKIAVVKEEADSLVIGDKVVVSSKEFNPMITKVGQG